MNDTPTPQGELAIQTVAMPADTNANGDIFGGWLVSQMDIAASIIAKKQCHCRTVTVAIDKMNFHLPVAVGDMVSCYGEVIKVGHTSMVIQVEAWKTQGSDGQTFKVTEGIFTFVAIDEAGKPQPVDRS